MDHRGDDDTLRAAKRPVFLHGAWRSGSTYYWSRFRALPETLCFYEPLHHSLAKLTHKRIAQGGAEVMAALNHPALSQPYFAEYAPLIDRRGVRAYRRALAYDRFHLDTSDANPRLERYIETLLEHARLMDRRAVLGFNRSCGRVGWLKARFNAFDIHIDREPASIWGSYAAEQGQGNDTFFSMWLRILEANQTHPLWAPLAERLKPRGPLARHLTRTRKAHHAQISAMGIEESYLLVFYAWLATAPGSMAECDLVIDDGLLGQPHHARRIEEAIRIATGLPIDLSDAQVRLPRRALDETVRRRVEAEALALFPRGGSVKPVESAGWTDQLCARKVELLAALA